MNNARINYKQEILISATRMSVPQKHQSSSSLAPLFNTFFLINLNSRVLKQVAAKPGIWGQAKLFLLQPFGIRTAALLKHREIAQEATTTLFLQDDSGLQGFFTLILSLKFTSAGVLPNSMQ